MSWRRNMSAEDARRARVLSVQGDQCITRAETNLGAGLPAAAREWFEAAHAAFVAARAITDEAPVAKEPVA